jgi:hypothetical protein
MSSVGSETSQVNTNALYINLVNIQSKLVDANLSTVAWTSAIDTTAGSVVLRDMGKTIYLPNPTASSSENAVSSILRKVQWVPRGTYGVYGTGAEASGTGAAGGALEYYTAYIQLGAVTYGGGTGVPTGVVRIN